MVKVTKQDYEPPRILREVTFAGGMVVLAGSVVDNISAVKISGQKVTDVEKGDDFEYSWD